MAMFARLIRQGDVIFDIGSHIGYVGLYLASLTGKAGKVFCFEPSPVNLRYLEVNAERSSLKNVTVVRAAAGDRIGNVPFFMESVTGQNSTTVRGFRGLEINSAFNGLPTEYEECTVGMITVDSLGVLPNFVKIDAEGSELSVLQGMGNVLRTAKPDQRLKPRATRQRSPTSGIGLCDPFPQAGMQHVCRTATTTRESRSVANNRPIPSKVKFRLAIEALGVKHGGGATVLNDLLSVAVKDHRRFPAFTSFALRALCAGLIFQPRIRSQKLSARRLSKQALSMVVADLRAQVVSP